MLRDREYLTTLLHIGLPIALQNFISTSLNAVGVLLVGQLGGTEVAAVGLSNQIFFLLNLMLFGITSGSAIFTAQYWGSGDVRSIRKVVLLCLALALTAGSIFSILALGFPRVALGFYTADPVVIGLGEKYLRIIGLSYLATAVSFTYGAQLRSTGNVRPPMLVSVVALSLGTLINYILIFGKLGFPAMGVEGAALGTCIARILECAAMLAVTYLGRYPTAARLQDLRAISRAFVSRFAVTVAPVVLNETVWSMGITIYNMIYARISTEAIAAVNICSTIEGLAFVIFIGISNASSIMIGNQIGAGDEVRAFQYGRRALLIGISGALLAGAVLALGANQVLRWYNITETSAEYARGILIVMGLSMWIKVSNMTIVVGILRAGGDTRFSLFLDTGTLWLIGIPMAWMGAFLLHLPVYWVFALAMSDEITKLIIGLFRYRSKRWINNLAQQAAA